ncbi:hypothetical protein BDZ97DRAFT_1762246 [Flammula alnicola]|nr:hypothetical protein BDZ97DRAFT_1762246 [Flammula alnicola]
MWANRGVQGGLTEGISNLGAICCPPGYDVVVVVEARTQLSVRALKKEAVVFWGVANAASHRTSDYRTVMKTPPPTLCWAEQMKSMGWDMMAIKGEECVRAVGGVCQSSWRGRGICLSTGRGTQVHLKDILPEYLALLSRLSFASPLPLPTSKALKSIGTNRPTRTAMSHAASTTTDCKHDD